MKLSLILESVQDQIQELASKHRQDPSTIIDTCRTIGEKYWKWVLKQWYSGTIILPEDSHRVQEALQNFQKAYHRLPPGQKDINKYKRVSDLEAVVEPLLGISSSTKSHDINLPGVEVVSQQGPYTTIKVSDQESLKDLGEGTKWCTRRSYPKCYAEKYIKDHGHIFIILQNGRPVIQYTPNYEEIKDVDDNKVTDPVLLDLIPEPSLDSDLNMLCSYAANVRRGRWPEAEPIIMKDPRRVYYYARHVIKGRWPEAEPYIMKDPEWAYYYAVYIIQDRWPEAEPIIMKDPGWAHIYALNVIRGRWPEAEPIIMKDSHSAYYYAYDVIKGRWPEAEPYIRQDKTLWGQYTADIGALATAKALATQEYLSNL